MSSPLDSLTADQLAQLETWKASFLTVEGQINTAQEQLVTYREQQDQLRESMATMLSEVGFFGDYAISDEWTLTTCVKSGLTKRPASA